MESFMGVFTGENAAASRRTGRALLVMTAALAFTANAAQAGHHKGKASADKAAAAQPADGCRQTPDQASIGMRALQTELMVAGLKCSADQWNSFTAKFKTAIKTDADRLQHLFNKTYGKAGPTHMNAFVTQLANDASQRSNQMTEANYCQQEGQLFLKVLALTEKDLEHFAVHRALAVPAPVSLCQPEDDKPAAPAVTLASATAAPGAPAQAAVGTGTPTAAGSTPTPAAQPPASKQNSGGLFSRLFGD
jgi:hypothetical protein